jgi:hypothetical protein
VEPDVVVRPHEAVALVPEQRVLVGHAAGTQGRHHAVGVLAPHLPSVHETRSSFSLGEVKYTIALPV